MKCEVKGLCARRMSIVSANICVERPLVATPGCFLFLPPGVIGKLPLGMGKENPQGCEKKIPRGVKRKYPGV